jgi:hypothetical protein
LKLGNASTDDSSASHFTDSDLGISICCLKRQNKTSFLVSLQNTNGHFSKKPYQLLFIRFVKLQTADSVPFVVLLYKNQSFLIILNINLTKKLLFLLFQNHIRQLATAIQVFSPSATLISCLHLKIHHAAILQAGEHWINRHFG